jgi:chlorophyll synthase
LLTFFGNPEAAGITNGIRLELALIILAILLFVRKLRQAWRPAIGAALASYLVIFFWLCLPSWLYLLSGATAHQPIDFFRLVSGSSLAAFSLNDLSVGLPPDSALALFMNALMGRLNLLLALLMAAWWYWRVKPSEFRSIIGNSRWPRVVHWLLLFGLGLSFVTLTIGRRPGGWNDWLAVVVAAVGLYAAWMFAVGMNDIVDSSLDKAANPARPLPSGEVTGRRLAEASVMFLLAALLAGYLSGPPVLFSVIVFTAAYWVYSMPPLRLKRWVGVNSLLVALACLAVVAAGYFVLSPGASLAAMPGRLAWLIVLAFGLAANVKDLKDIEGDRQEGIATVPVLLGARRGFLAVSGMVMVSFWLVPLVLGWPLLAATAVPAGLLAWPVILTKPYREIRVFLLYFVFAVASVILLWAV